MTRLSQPGHFFSHAQEGRAKRHSNLKEAAINGSYNYAIGACERELAEILETNGFDIVKQHLVGGYMIDMAMDNIAIEVISKHAFSPISADINRNEHLFQNNFRLVFVHCRNATTLLRNTDNLITAFTEIRNNPPPIGEVWMIKCSFHDVGNYEVNEFSIHKYKKKSLC